MIEHDDTSGMLPDDMHSIAMALREYMEREPEHMKEDARRRAIDHDRRIMIAYARREMDDAFRLWQKKTDEIADKTLAGLTDPRPGTTLMVTRDALEAEYWEAKAKHDEIAAYPMDVWEKWYDHRLTNPIKVDSEYWIEVPKPA